MFLNLNDFNAGRTRVYLELNVIHNPQAIKKYQANKISTQENTRAWGF